VFAAGETGQRKKQGKAHLAAGMYLLGKVIGEFNYCGYPQL
jgi:hypothetical protein